MVLENLKDDTVQVEIDVEIDILLEEFAILYLPFQIL